MPRSPGCRSCPATAEADAGGAAAERAPPSRSRRGRRGRDDQPHAAARPAHRRRHRSPRRRPRPTGCSTPPATRPPHPRLDARRGRGDLEEAKAEARQAGEAERCGPRARSRRSSPGATSSSPTSTTSSSSSSPSASASPRPSPSSTRSSERVPGGLGDVRRPLLSASDDADAGDAVDGEPAADRARPTARGRRRRAAGRRRRRPATSDGDDAIRPTPTSVDARSASRRASRTHRTGGAPRPAASLDATGDDEAITSEPSEERRRADRPQ